MIKCLILFSFILISLIPIFSCKESKLQFMTEEVIKQVNSTDIKSQPSGNCNYENCPIYQGVCYQGRCICSYGFTNLIQPGEPEISCNYKQKSRMTAFFLEFFFPIGAGHLYAGRLAMAFIKFSLFLIYFCGMCGELCCLNLNMDRSMMCSAFVILIDLCLWSTFQLVDLVCYAFGFYKDGNGLPMI